MTESSFCMGINRYSSKILLRFSILIFFVVLDPFEFASNGDKYAQGVFFTIAAPLYRMFSKKGEDQAPLTVILIDEPTLRQQLSYPLDDDSLTELIRQVACGGAAVVFVDMLLGQPRPGQRPMPNALPSLLRAQGADIPDGCNTASATIYMADLLPEANPSAASIAALQQEESGGEEYSIVSPTIRSAARRLPVNWTTERFEYPLKRRVNEAPGPFIDSKDRCGGSAEARGCWMMLGDYYVPTPALQLYLDLQKARQQPVDVDSLPETMVPAWGWKQLGELPEWYQHLGGLSRQPRPETWATWLCAQANPDPWPLEGSWKRLAAVGASTAQLALALAPRIRAWCDTQDGAPRQPYVYPLTISASQFLKNHAPGSHDPDYLAQAIRGRAVLIGLAAAAASDNYESPVHGIIPGVLLHAQALDNLLAWGNEVWRQPLAGKHDEARSGRVYRCVVLLCILTLLWLWWRGKRHQGAKRSYSKSVRACFLAMAMFLVLEEFFGEPKLGTSDILALLITTSLSLFSDFLENQKRWRIGVVWRILICLLLAVAISLCVAMLKFWAPVSWVGFLVLFIEKAIEEGGQLAGREKNDKDHTKFPAQVRKTW